MTRRVQQSGLVLWAALLCAFTSVALAQTSPAAGTAPPPLVLTPYRPSGIYALGDTVGWKVSVRPGAPWVMMPRARATSRPCTARGIVILGPCRAQSPGAMRFRYPQRLCCSPRRRPCGPPLLPRTRRPEPRPAWEGSGISISRALSDAPSGCAHSLRCSAWPAQAPRGRMNTRRPARGSAGRPRSCFPNTSLSGCSARHPRAISALGRAGLGHQFVDGCLPQVTFGFQSENNPSGLYRHAHRCR
jgi:hypothetical protein